MLVKTDDLTGQALDFAVAKLQGLVDQNGWSALEVFQGSRVSGNHRYSTDWAQGGPIIDQENIGFKRHTSPLYGNHISATKWNERGDIGVAISQGPTNLIAAMRCYVASKLGSEVDIPEEIIQ